jgi:hypothetical protein
MDFEVKDVDKYRLIVVDTTRQSISDLPKNIYAMTMDVVSEKIPQPLQLDLLEYMFVNQVDNELYGIDSATLGLGSGVVIPDGAYEFVLKVNGIDEGNVGVIVVSTIQEQLEVISENIDENLALTDEFIRNDALTDPMLHYYYAMSLYAKLILTTAKEFSSEQADILIGQIQRVLSIINEEEFEFKI